MMGFSFEDIDQSEVDHNLLDQLRQAFLEIASSDVDSSVLNSVDLVVTGDLRRSVVDRIGGDYSANRSLGDVAAKTIQDPPGTFHVILDAELMTSAEATANHDPRRTMQHEGYHVLVDHYGESVQRARRDLGLQDETREG